MVHGHGFIIEVKKNILAAPGGENTRRAPQESEKLKIVGDVSIRSPWTCRGLGTGKPGFLLQGFHFRIAARESRENRRPSGKEALAGRKYAVSRDLKVNSPWKNFFLPGWPLPEASVETSTAAVFLAMTRHDAPGARKGKFPDIAPKKRPKTFDLLECPSGPPERAGRSPGVFRGKPP
jgi:hypothetical protein